MTTRKPSALVLFSGGLDSILVVKLLREQGIPVQAVFFSCPFYSSECAIKSARALRLRIHEVPVDSSYFRMVKNPPHGYGANMNPCIDCKVYMLRRAEKLRKSMGLDFLATGEVVGERPLSQTRHALMQIEKLSSLSGKILRPLSGGILPSTFPEIRGLVKRKKLLSIHGRSRKPQLALAMKYRVKEFPAPAGGCLLTDPEYSGRLKEHLRYNSVISWDIAELLKYGRQFRFKKTKIIVGRNETDNNSILRVAKRLRLPRLEVLGHPGPLTIIASKRPTQKSIEAAASLTVRYSDAPVKPLVSVELIQGKSRRLLDARAIPRRDLERMRIQAST